MTSSAYLSSSTYPTYDEPTPANDHAAPVSPSNEPSRYTRESAPEPETPSYSRVDSSYDYTPSAAEPSSPTPSSPFQAPYSPTPIDRQTPFGSPPVSPIRPAASALGAQDRPRAKPDLSALLGEEKPILPSFKRREPSEGVAGPLGSKIAVLPVSSIGKKTVGGALATLLGLEVEEEDAIKPKAKVPLPSTAATEVELPTPASPAVSTSVDAMARTRGAESSSTTDPAPDAAPVEPLDEPSHSDDSASLSHPLPILSALSVPLPPSPSVSPPPPDDSGSGAQTPQAPAFSRASSRAQSTLSVDSSEANPPYDSMVSPMDTEDGPVAQGMSLGDKAIGGTAIESLGQKLAALNVEDGGSSATPVEPAKMDEDEISAASSEPTPTETTGDTGSTLPSTSSSVLSPPPTSYAGPDPFAQYTYDVPPANAPSFDALSPNRSRGFRSYNGSNDEGGFGGADDVDSLRGTYSRSVETGDGDADDGETETGGSTTAVDRVRRSIARAARAPLTVSAHSDHLAASSPSADDVFAEHADFPEERRDRRVSGSVFHHLRRRSAEDGRHQRRRSAHGVHCSDPSTLDSLNLPLRTR